MPTSDHIASKATVVVVDDSPTSLQFATTVLAEAGFEVRTAQDGEAVIELVENVRPDVVLLDIILPKKNGFQVCRELKTRDTDGVKIVLVSCKNQKADRVWGQRQGADAYLTKPFEATKLLAVVNAVLANGPDMDA